MKCLNLTLVFYCCEEKKTILYTVKCVEHCFATFVQKSEVFFLEHSDFWVASYSPFSCFFWRIGKKMMGKNQWFSCDWLSTYFSDILPKKVYGLTPIRSLKLYWGIKGLKPVAQSEAQIFYCYQIVTQVWYIVSCCACFYVLLQFDLS